jgi:hypothetical protein
MESYTHQIVGAMTTLLQTPTKTETEKNHLLRMELEPFFMNALREQYSEEWTKYWNQKGPSKIGETDKTILFVERRVSPNLPLLLKNAVYYARGFSLTIVCSQQNRLFLEMCVAPYLHRVRILPLFSDCGTPQKGKDEYNALLQNPDFWNQIPESYVLTMETDCYLRKPLPESVFLYDYVASKWAWAPERPGGGGLSFRSVQMMKRLCAESKHYTYAQDCFVSDSIEKQFPEYKIPSFEESGLYMIESLYSLECCGIHQAWTFLTQLYTNKELLYTVLRALLTCKQVVF